MKRNAFTLVELLIAVAIIAVLAAFLWPVGTGTRENAPRSSCASNLKQIGLAFAQYNNDYDDKFPLVSRPEGWVGLLQPYLKSELIFRCPSEELRGADNLTDYWFNRRLASVETKDVDNASLTFLSGDGEPSDDPNVSLQSLPPRWIEREDSPIRRHLETGNYLFADGHVKSYKPQRIEAAKSGEKTPTFSVR